MTSTPVYSWPLLDGADLNHFSQVNDAFLAIEATVDDIVTSSTGMTEADGDARYLRLVGGSLSGALSVAGATTVGGALTVAGKAVAVSASTPNTLIWTTDGFWVPPVGGTLTVEEADGTPSVPGVSTLKVSNGTLTDEGGGVVMLTIGAGGGLASDPLANAKGDVFVASGDNAIGRLPVGSNGELLTADSTQTLGVRWAPPSPTITVASSAPGSPATGDLWIW